MQRITRTALAIILLVCAPASALPVQQHGGEHDFDFAFGTWKTHIKFLPHGSSKWIAVDGTVVTRKIWQGRANLEEIEAPIPSAYLEGMTLRLYDPDAKQWSLYFANSSDGHVDDPLVGEFNEGRGEFYSQETINGQATFVRNAYSDVTVNSYRFEQAFSSDAGKTWHPDFVANLTRQDPKAAQLVHPKAVPPFPGQHAFDWQFGLWRLHMWRLLHPLSQAAVPAELDGTVDVSKIWNGRANIAEIVASGPTNHIEILALRLYLPKSHQWTISFAGSGGGGLTAPMFGTFKNGRGEFYDQETIGGRAVWDRFIFFDMRSNSARDEEGLSEDGGKSWVTTFNNWHSRIQSQNP